MTIPNMFSGGDAYHLQRNMELISAVLPSYDYLEIGSYLGASLQWHLTNDKCNSVMSIDLRPQGAVKDERSEFNEKFSYDVTTQDMLQGLKDHNLPLDKLICIDGTVDDIPADKKFDIVFIDAEHTNEAVFYDAMHCLPAMKESCIMLFHDAWIVHQGLEKFSNHLDSINRHFVAAKMQNCDMYAVAMGSMIDPFVNYAREYAEDWDTFKAAAVERLAQNN